MFVLFPELSLQLADTGDALDYVEPCLPCASVSVETLDCLDPYTL